MPTNTNTFCNKIPCSYKKNLKDTLNTLSLYHDSPFWLSPRLEWEPLILSNWREMPVRVVPREKVISELEAGLIHWWINPKSKSRFNCGKRGVPGGLYLALAPSCYCCDVSCFTIPCSPWCELLCHHILQPWWTKVFPFKLFSQVFDHSSKSQTPSYIIYQVTIHLTFFFSFQHLFCISFSLISKIKGLVIQHNHRVHTWHIQAPGLNSQHSSNNISYIPSYQ